MNRNDVDKVYDLCIKIYSGSRTAWDELENLMFPKTDSMKHTVPLHPAHGFVPPPFDESMLFSADFMLYVGIEPTSSGYHAGTWVRQYAGGFEHDEDDTWILGPIVIPKE